MLVYSFSLSLPWISPYYFERILSVVLRINMFIFNRVHVTVLLVVTPRDDVVDYHFR